jgi:hypothetical protein
VELWRPSGLVGTVPISQGSVDWSLSRNDERAGRLQVPGYEWFDLLSPRHYGWVVVKVSLEGEEFDLGEFPIVSVKVEQPGGLVDVVLGDWSIRRSRDLVEQPEDSLVSGVTLAEMARTHLNISMPWGVTCTRDDTNGAMMPTPSKLQAGADVWDAMQAAANLVGARIVVTSRSTFEIRVYDPSIPWVENLDGVLVRGSRTVSAAKGSACNRVIVTVDGADGQVFRSVQTMTGGNAPYAYDAARFGRAQSVERATVQEPSQAAADAEALRLANRRFGALYTVTAEVVPMPWLEVGDPVTVLIAGVREDFLIETLRMPLTADEGMALTARSDGSSAG